jgi:predicted lipoprotein with Yx(FWY)xxD motif
MRGLVVVALTSAILLAGCGGGTTKQPSGQASSTGEATPSQPTTGSPITGPPTAPASPRNGVVVKTAGSQFGQVLFNGAGQAIYLFDKETTATPQCYAACAEAWPPVLTDGEPVAAASAQADRLSTTKRTDGSVQVTYGGHPIYYYAHEGKNEVRCHNVRGFGGLWLAVTPAGSAAAH